MSMRYQNPGSSTLKPTCCSTRRCCDCQSTELPNNHWSQETEEEGKRERDLLWVYLSLNFDSQGHETWHALHDGTCRPSGTCITLMYTGLLSIEGLPHCSCLGPLTERPHTVAHTSVGERDWVRKRESGRIVCLISTNYTEKNAMLFIFYSLLWWIRIVFFVEHANVWLSLNGDCQRVFGKRNNIKWWKTYTKDLSAKRMWSQTIPERRGP